MKRLFFILGFLLLSALPLYGVVGCGPGTDNSECGNVGDPYEGGSFDPTGKYALTDCLNPLITGRSYYLQNDVSAATSADTCFGLPGGGNVTLDLRTFTVTGKTVIHGYSGNGIIIFNGIINCSAAPLGSDTACIYISASSSAYTSKTRLHHLTVNNSAEPGGNPIAAIYLERGPLDGDNTAIEVDHITGSVHTALTSNRAEFVRLTTSMKVDVHNNDLTCNADVKACNLIEIPGGTGYVNGLVHNNKVTVTTNTIVGGGLPRAIVISGSDSGSVGTRGWQVYENYCTANNGRCFRFRQVNDILVHDNEVVNCVNTPYGCYHFADPSSGTAYVGDAQANIYNETIALGTGGVAFWLRDGNGWTVKNSTVTGTHGQLGQLLTPIQPPPGGPVPTSATFCGITGAAGLDVNSTAAASTTVHAYLAGTWGGAGTIDNMGSCAGVGGTPTAIPSPTVLTFSARLTGTTSAAQIVTLTNTGDAALTITSIIASGDFAQTNDCGASLGAGLSCSISVTFTAAHKGTLAGAITVTDDAADFPQIVTLSGTGEAQAIGGASQVGGATVVY